MELSESTSQGKLDQLLADGKISEDEYAQLSKAMDRGSSEKPGAATGSGERRRLNKDVHRAKIAGVCAGLARYFDMDPVVVRIIAVVSVFVVGPMTLLLYLILSVMLPWDDPEAARASQSHVLSLRFPLRVALLFLVLPFLYSVKVLPILVDILDEADAAIESGTVQGMLFLIVLNVGDMVSRYPLITLFLGTFWILFLSAVYYFAWSDRFRRIYVMSVIGAGMIWLLLLVLGSVLPILSIPTDV